MEKTLLAVFAYPDDEAFGSEGTLAYYANHGVKVVLVCATRGEAGEIAHATQFGPENFFRRLPDSVLKDLLSQENFALAWPHPKPNESLTGLFTSTNGNA
jgi:hypothetical protein